MLKLIDKVKSTDYVTWFYLSLGVLTLLFLYTTIRLSEYM